MRIYELQIVLLRKSAAMRSLQSKWAKLIEVKFEMAQKYNHCRLCIDNKFKRRNEHEIKEIELFRETAMHAKVLASSIY